MKQHGSYVGFSASPETDELIDALINDPPEIRWRVVRTILRIEDWEKLSKIRHRLRERVKHIWPSLNWKVQSRINLAMNSIQRPVRVKDYTVVRGKGAFRTEELKTAGYNEEKPANVIPDAEYYPLIEFHVHPKIPDLKFLSDLKKAGISHAVILATDTDPGDVDRPEIIEKLRRNYSLTKQSQKVPFEKLLMSVRSDLYSNTHVTNQDVADWISDYPDILIGFGSVNLSKSKEYVEEKLVLIENLGLKGIKLLPYSQFFNPSENDNIKTLFEYCRKTGATILSHSGYAAGPFELAELSRDCHPKLWETMVKKYPDVPVVLAHFASYSSHYPGIWFHEALEMMKKYRNVHADVSAVTYLLDDEKKVKKIRVNNCFDQVLFATDYPGPLYYGISLERIVKRIKANPFLSSKEKYAVLGGNAKRILKLP